MLHLLAGDRCQLQHRFEECLVSAACLFSIHTLPAPEATALPDDGPTGGFFRNGAPYPNDKAR